MAREARLRFLGRHHFEELLLARRPADGREQIEPAGRGCGALGHGQSLTMTEAPSGWPSRSGGTRIQPSACAMVRSGR